MTIDMTAGSFLMTGDVGLGVLAERLIPETLKAHISR